MAEITFRFSKKVCTTNNCDNDDKDIDSNSDLSGNDHKIVVNNARAGHKLLAIAIRNKVPIRFGCSSCRCGTCAIKLNKGKLSDIQLDEHQLLEKLDIYQSDQSVRLSCRARVLDSDCEVDLKFQKTYDPSKINQHDDKVVYHQNLKSS